VAMAAHRLQTLQHKAASGICPHHRRRQNAVDESRIRESMALVSAMHIIAAVWIKDHTSKV
jgi:thiamine phosphate synthase YjbQ (UPF0047 family)